MLKMPVRTKEVEIGGAYEGFKCTVNTAIPMYVFTYFQTGNWSLIQSALKTVLVSWNFADAEGNPLPQPHETIEAKDSFGRPVLAPQIGPNGLPETDEAGAVIEKPVLIPAISLIPADLGMAIVRKVTENIGVLPAP